MAITWVDGFDMDVDGNDLNRRGYVIGSASLAAPQTGRFGGRTLRLTNGNNIPVTLPITSTDTLSLGIAYKGDNMASFAAGGDPVIRFRNGSTDILVLGITSTGQLKVGRGTLATQVCISAAGVMIGNVWHFIEIEITRHASAGDVEVFCDGVSVASATGVNTGASSIDVIGINGGYTNQDFDDFYLTNVATRVGECRVETLRPSANATPLQWTPNASTNVSRVNTSQLDGDTTYNSSSTVGHQDLFDLDNLSTTPTTIYAVKTELNARKDDAASRSVRTNMKNGATTTNGTTLNLAASYTIQHDIYELNPDDAAPFAAADVNAMQLGYEVVA